MQRHLESIPGTVVNDTCTPADYLTDSWQCQPGTNQSVLLHGWMRLVKTRVCGVFGENDRRLGDSLRFVEFRQATRLSP